MKQQLAYSLAEARVASGGSSRTFMYEEIKAGKLIAHKRGKRTVILHENLVRWIATFPRLETGAGNASSASPGRNS